MLDPRGPRIFLLLLCLTAIGSASAAAPSESRRLASCSSCWPLSGPYPGSLMVADGTGGAYVVWVEGDSRWRLQRLRGDLTTPKPWPADGQTIRTGGSSKALSPLLVADGSGGVYVAWVEQADNGDMSARLLRVRSDGRPQSGWPDTGVCLSAPSPFVNYPALVRTNHGAAVAWMEARDGAQQIRLAAVDPNGRPVARWPREGLTLGQSNSAGDVILLASDDRGGVFTAWTEMRERLSDIHASYASERGPTTASWPVVARAVPVSATMLEHHPEMVTDGLGGALIVWTDERSQESVRAMDLMDVFAQRMSATGAEAWTPAARGSHAIADGSGYQLDGHVVSDGSGGGYFAWNEHGPGAEDGGRIQHLDSRGFPAPGWPADGLRLGVEVSSLIPDLAGGVFAIWTDGSDAYLQRFESRWSPDFARPASFSLGPPTAREKVRVSADGRGGAFLAWEERTQGTIEIQVQHVSLGAWMASGVLPPATTEAPALAFAAHPVFPNPARAQCRIAFDLPSRTRVSIDVFDVAGRRVARLADGRVFEAGAQSVSWDLANRQGRRVAPGLYLVRVVAGRDQATMRTTVTR